MDIFENWKRESHLIQKQLEGIEAKVPEFGKELNDFESVREYLKALNEFYYQYQDEKTYQYICEQAAKTVIEHDPECREVSSWDKELIADYYINKGDYRNALHWLGGRLMTLPPSNYRHLNKIHLIVKIAEIMYKHRNCWDDAENLLIYALEKIRGRWDEMLPYKVMIHLLDLYCTMNKRCITTKPEKAEEIFSKYCSRELEEICCGEYLQKFSIGKIWIQLSGQMKKAGVGGYREFAQQGMKIQREAFVQFGVIDRECGYVKIADGTSWHVDTLKRTLRELEDVLEEVFAA